MKLTNDELLAMLNGLIGMTESLGGAIVLIRANGQGEVYADLAEIPEDLRIREFPR